jgi:hypothetical protein
MPAIASHIDVPGERRVVMDAGRAERVPPDPVAMIESMRAFGYSLPTAIADLVDNSITAGASEIRIVLHWAGSGSWIAVLDNGRGMDDDELTRAMRLGSRSPVEQRSPKDLGRFGLGLKTASLSQARSLTVASKGGHRELNVRRWDLDVVTRSRDWTLLLDPSSGSEGRLDPVRPLEHGTIVLLERLDRLAEDTDPEDDRAHRRFLEQIRRTHEHLAMVFHRFLAGRRAISMWINDHRIEPWDPFLLEHPASQHLQVERLPFVGAEVVVSPHVLPHISKLSQEEHRRASGPRGWNAHQGFYVYRAKRLLVSGDWLGLPYKQEEHHKLARIAVDLDTDMDLAWQIDVRKATARIPGPLRDALRRIADATRLKASAAYRYRGKTVARATTDGGVRFIWRRERGRDGAITYRISRDHPLIAAVLTDADGSAPKLERALRLAEESLPIAAIVMDASEDPDRVPSRAPYEGKEQEVLTMLRGAHIAMVSAGADPRQALAVLAEMEPFDSHPVLIAVLDEELQRDE